MSFARSRRDDRRNGDRGSVENLDQDDLRFSGDGGGDGFNDFRESASNDFRGSGSNELRGSGGNFVRSGVGGVGEDGRLSRKSSFADEENKLAGKPQDLPEQSRPQLQPYTPYDKLFFVLAVIIPPVCYLCGGLNGAQINVFMTRWLVRDRDNQWEYNTWDIINQSNATLYGIVSRMAGVASVYPAVVAESVATAPFITLSQFELYGQNVRQNGEALFFAYSPFIGNDTQRSEWQNYSVANQNWIEESFSYTNEVFQFIPIRPEIWNYNAKGLATVTPPGNEPYVPSWQSSPPPTDSQKIVNQDLTGSTSEVYQKMVSWILGDFTPILSEPVDVNDVYGPNVVPGASTVVGTVSILTLPVYGALSLRPTDVVGFVSAVIPWTTFFQNILPTKIVGFVLVIESCGTVNNTFEINGANVSFLGPGDLHDPEYDYYVEVSPFADFGVQEFQETNNFCPHTLYMYRSDAWNSLFTIANRETRALVAVCVCSFVVIGIGFRLYDYFLRLRFSNRFRIAIEKFFNETGGTRSTAILQSINSGDAEFLKLDRVANASEIVGKTFPETTVLFADIVGFSEWSSGRDPGQVFTLLDAVFSSFDAIAERNGVYKVETFGDNYVAVCGAPVPNMDHPLIMCQFARECLQRAKEVFREVSPQLGPGTADLAMRFGLSSGPVTATIIRGDQPRLQLLGETVNTAAYIKTTGKRNMIHLSQQTANLIIASGRRNLVVERTDRRGPVRTYWLLTLDTDRASSLGNVDVDESEDGFEIFDSRPSLVESARAIRGGRSDFAESRTSKENRILRLVQYNSETLVDLLKQVVARRQATQRRRSSLSSLTNAARRIGNGSTVIEEAVDTISLPEVDPRFARNGSFRSAMLSPEVVEQVYSFVAVIAGLYRDNAFHNFEHASHMTTSLSKMLTRVEASRIDSSLEDNDRKVRNFDYASSIAGEPLVQFAMIMAALVHDVDHRGVPNNILSNEEPTLAAAYQDRSVHEQNALELAWNVLLSEGFEELRACIFADLNELQLFRQILVNSVIATDVFDPEIRALQRDRYNQAFSGGFRNSVSDVNRKATIMIEYLVQAADLAPTMQPWFLYLKWNEKLFEEAYEAYRTGRTSRDPSSTWYEDEIDFFDKYTIPLAKRLKNSDVFGVAGDEYLNFAEENRRKWVARGQEIVSLYVENYGRNDRLPL